MNTSICGSTLKAICFGIDLGRDGLGVEQGGLHRQFLDGLLAGAGHRLVGADVDAGDADGIVDRLERDQHLDRRAVRVGDDAAVLVLGDRLRIDLRHHQRDVVVVAELRGVVDHHAAGRRRLGRVHRRHRGARREQADLHLREIELGEVLDHQHAITELHPAARGTAAGHGIDLADREFALREDLQHGLADRTRRTHHRHIVLLAHVRSDLRKKIKTQICHETHEIHETKIWIKPLIIFRGFRGFRGYQQPMFNPAPRPPRRPSPPCPPGACRGT
jgi:hypothetical protein